MKETPRAARRVFRLSSIAGLIGVGLLVIAIYWAASHAYVFTDWLRLRNYQPAARVSELAQQTTMTDTSRHLFYLNRPGIEDKTAFSQSCARMGEQTIVLGCYKGGQRGIHVLAVEDDRLQGVEQVTAAHEMLHAAYERLNRTERQRVDAMLQDYADHDLTNERIKKALKAYEQSEPGQQYNEMHSMFGTEIDKLPDGLEQYYKRYFSNRRAVVAYANRYQSAFTLRQEAVANYDKQLKTMNATIKANTTDLTVRQKAIEAEAQRLDGLRSNGNIQAYNGGVDGYNTQIDDYNQLLDATQLLIDQYNDIVKVRNGIAAETVDLQQAIDSSSLTKK